MFQPADRKRVMIYPDVRTVLVIDDDPTQCLLIEDHLRESGFDVVTAASGPEGYAMARQVIPDLIMLDVMMPFVNGFNICSELGLNQRTAHIPVVLMTGLHGPEALIQGSTAGAVDFITKPIDWRTLPRRIEHVLDCVSIGGM